MEYTKLGNQLRITWRRFKKSVLEENDSLIQRLIYFMLAPIARRIKHMIPLSDCSSLALWLMYHPEAGILPCEGYRMKNIPHISMDEMVQLKERFENDLQKVKGRLGVKDVILSTVQIQPVIKKIAVHVHMFFPDVMPRILSALDQISVPFDLYVSFPEGTVVPDQLYARSNCFLRNCPNRGRDIAPMICLFGRELAGYDIVAHFHTKKSQHTKYLGDWLGHILAFLLGSPTEIHQILSLLESGYGMVCAPDFTSISEDPTGWMRNLSYADGIARKVGLDVNLAQDFKPMLFPQGSMFWANGRALRRFLTLPLTFEDFPQEPIGLDGSIAHALERMFFLWVMESGMKVARIVRQ